MLPLLGALIAPVDRQMIALEVEGVKREYLKYVGSPSPKEGHPLVFCFHGHGGTMRSSELQFRAHNHWPGSIVVYPQGLPMPGKFDPEGKKPGWQRNPGEVEDRDLKFIDAILAQVKKAHKIDTRRIYAMGHSNGGKFVYLLWLARGDVFAAFAPSGSTALLQVPRLPRRPAFVIAGEKDTVVPIAPQLKTMDALRRVLQVDTASGKVEGHCRYEMAKDGIELGTYVYPGGHNYPRDAGKLSVEFFKRHQFHERC